MKSSTTVKTYLDEQTMDAYITAAATEYMTSAPTVTAWLEDLYQRVLDAPERVTLVELRQMQRLYEDGQWMQPNYAANTIYKLMDSLGQETTGHAGW